VAAHVQHIGLHPWQALVYVPYIALQRPDSNQGDDDFFSSDLPENRLNEIWGNSLWADVFLMVLYSADDQYVPNFVNKTTMVQKWETTYRSHIKNSSAVDGFFEILHHANHELADERFDVGTCPR
jgi:hypothetical protein